jgi:uncharacterized protein YjaZ
MRERGVDGGGYALVYSVVEDVREEDGIPTRSSANIDESKRARTILAMWVRSAGERSAHRQ